jgi:hypothetical protein
MIYLLQLYLDVPAKFYNFYGKAWPTGKRYSWSSSNMVGLPSKVYFSKYL